VQDGSEVSRTRSSAAASMSSAAFMRPGSPETARAGVGVAAAVSGAPMRGIAPVPYWPGIHGSAGIERNRRRAVGVQHSGHGSPLVVNGVVLSE